MDETLGKIVEGLYEPLVEFVEKFLLEFLIDVQEKYMEQFWSKTKKIDVGILLRGSRKTPLTNFFKNSE